MTFKKDYINRHSRGNALHPLDKRRDELQLMFEAKGWYVISKKHFFGLTGYKKRIKGQKGPRTPRTERIVSINCFLPTVVIPRIPYPIWEVVTHWTSSRNLFDEFEPALKMFLNEAQKYNPKTIKWSTLESEEII